MKNLYLYRKNMKKYPYVIILSDNITLSDDIYIYKFDKKSSIYLNFISEITDNLKLYVTNKQDKKYSDKIKNLYYKFFDYQVSDKYKNIIYNYVFNNLINRKYTIKKINEYNENIDILFKTMTCKNKYFIINKDDKKNYNFFSLIKYNNILKFKTLEDVHNIKNLDFTPVNNNTKYYLTINNKKINKINGPVSLYILKPKEKYYGYKLPLLILFGDSHFSKINQCMCIKNECNNVQNTFLNLINDMKINNKNDKNIIFTYDLYVEKNNVQKYVLEQDNYEDFLSDLRKNYCFTNKDKCSYKNINWHYIDLRIFRNMKNKDKNNIHFILEVILKNVEQFDDSKYTNIIEYVQYFNKYFYAYILHISGISLKKINYDEIIDMLYSFKYDKNDSHLLLPNYDRYKHNNVLIYIYYFLDNYNIYKQLLKIDDNLKRNLIKNIIKYIKTKYKNKDKNLSSKNIDFIINFFKNYTDKNVIYDFKNIIKNNDISHNVVLFNSILLDIYFIVRNFKVSYDKNYNKYKSILSIGYFGSAHTDNLCNFYIKNYYDLEYKNIHNYDDYHNDIRCVKLDKDINLDNLLNDLYVKYNDNKDIITKYYSSNLNIN